MCNAYSCHDAFRLLLPSCLPPDNPMQPFIFSRQGVACHRQIEHTTLPSRRLSFATSVTAAVSHTINGKKP